MVKLQVASWVKGEQLSGCLHERLVLIRGFMLVGEGYMLMKGTKYSIRFPLANLHYLPMLCDQKISKVQWHLMVVIHDKLQATVIACSRSIIKCFVQLQEDARVAEGTSTYSIEC
jgi:hypothetical protein